MVRYVQQAVSFAIPDPVRQDIPCAAVTVVKATSEEDLLKYAAAKLGRCAPKLVMVLAEMPVRGIGKPDRNAIRQIAMKLLDKQRP